MEDKLEIALSRYEMRVRKRFRSRGGWVLDTDKGFRLLREYDRIHGHFRLENEVKVYLVEQGFDRVDSVCPNGDGEQVTELETGEKYVMYRWFAGEECDLRSGKCLAEAGANLGNFHKKIQGFSKKDENAKTEPDLLDQFRRHNRELKRVNTYMKSKKRKNEFEIYAINCFDRYYEKACVAEERLAGSGFYQMIQGQQGDICHGDYNYHNLLMAPEGVATIGFERVGYGIQLLDFTYFMRKTLEKNNWEKRAGDILLQGYDKTYTLSEKKMEFIEIMLLYPEKYWKLMNHYYNKKKAWISARSLEKLKDMGGQENNREIFLKGWKL